MNIGLITQTFRRFGLMHWLDRVKFRYQRWKNRAKNAQYVQQNPDLVLPPDYMLFEAFQLDYQKYYEGGAQTAEKIQGLLATFGDMRGKKVLDWGCGPARVVRHFPVLLGPRAQIHGADYNPDTIAWCKAHIKGVTFAVNQLDPPTQYPHQFFDFVYGISIFTHLSAVKHREWWTELMRITEPGGLVLLTTHGAVFTQKLTPSEQALYALNQLVVRGDVVEGHRVYAAFQPPVYFRELVQKEAEICAHIPGKEQSWGLEQDFWILKKRKM